MQFIGITISKSIDHSLLEEFNDGCVSWKLANDSRICLFYKNKCSLDLEKVKLKDYEFLRLINTLKKVESEKLYDSYDDNMGYHHIKQKKKILIRKI